MVLSGHRSPKCSQYLLLYCTEAYAGFVFQVFAYREDFFRSSKRRTLLLLAVFDSREGCPVLNSGI